MYQNLRPYHNKKIISFYKKSNIFINFAFKYIINMNNHKVLFVDSTHEKLLEILENSGFQCDYQPDIDNKNIEKLIANYEGLIIRSKIKLDKSLLNKANNLKFIGRVGAGLENIDVEYAESKGIKCFNSPEGNRDAVGEHAIAMLLALFNNLYRANFQVKHGIWKREINRGLEIKGKTIGIIGYGNMGSAFAKRLQGFDSNIIAYDKYKTKFGNEFVKEVSLKEIFEQTDILSFHVPLTSETKFMFNKTFIQNFKKPFYLINTARGKVVKTNDLVIAMQENKILGAVLDVLEYEKTSFENLHNGQMPSAYQYLIESDKIMLSPHIAGWTVESNIKLSQFLAEKIVKDFKNISSVV